MQYSVILALAATAVVATQYESGSEGGYSSGYDSGSNSNWEISGPCSAPGTYRCHPSNTKIEVCAITGQYKFDWVKQADCGAQEKCVFREDNQTPYCLPKYSQGNETDTGYTSAPGGGTGLPQTTFYTRTRYSSGSDASSTAEPPYPTTTKGYGGGGYGGYNSSSSASPYTSSKIYGSGGYYASSIAAVTSATKTYASGYEAASTTLSGASQPTPSGTDDGEGEGSEEGETQGEGEGSGDDQ